MSALAVDEPDTDEPLTDAVEAESAESSSTGEYGGKSSLTLRAGELTTFGGLRLSPILRPVRSRPRSSSRRYIFAPVLLSRPRPAA